MLINYFSIKIIKINKQSLNENLHEIMLDLYKRKIDQMSMKFNCTQLC